MDAGIEGNFTRAEKLHLTVAFIGEYGNPDKILDIMEQIPFDPFTIRVERIELYREMYFAIMTNHPMLQSYVRRIRRELANAGIPFDRKAFKPHITLVRKAIYREKKPVIEWDGIGMQKLVKEVAFGTLIATVLFTVLYRLYPTGVVLTLAITAGTICYHFSMRLLVGFIFDRIMGNRADYRKNWYQLKPWEPSLYKLLRVKSWKGKMPTYNPDLFDPRKHSWDEIAQAMCQAELVHETIVVLSFLPIMAYIWFGSIEVFIITSLVSAGIDMIFVIMQRYNRPRIIQIAERKKHKD